MAYPYYQNNQFYMQDLQNMKDRIDRQMQQVQQMNQNQIQNQQPVPITQNFQLAPNPNNNELESKYVNNIDEVKNTFVMKTGVFINKDFTSLWIKDVTGNIRTFRTEEIIEMTIWKIIETTIETIETMITEEIMIDVVEK